MSSLLHAVDPLKLFRRVFESEIVEPRRRLIAAIRMEHERHDLAIIQLLVAARKARAEAKARKYAKQVCKGETAFALRALINPMRGDAAPILRAVT
jgi:hypothetical protein